MNRENLFDLYLVGGLTQEQRGELELLLRGDGDARREFLDYVMETGMIVRVGNRLLAAAHDTRLDLVDVAVDANDQGPGLRLGRHFIGGAAEPGSALNAAPVSAKVSWFSSRPLKAVAAGLIAGLLSASVAWAVALPWLAETRVKLKTIFAESFESNVTATLPGVARNGGVWSGDEATVVMAEQGVSPKSGSRMLRFMSATYPGESSRRSQWCDVYRLVDVSETGRLDRAVARITASFAEVPVSTGEQYMCSVEAIALDLGRDTLPSPLLLSWAKENASASSARKLPMAGSCQWQAVSAEVPISSKTKFVLLHLAMYRNAPVISNGAVRFSGHYLDDVKLELVSRH